MTYISASKKKFKNRLGAFANSADWIKQVKFQLKRQNSGSIVSSLEHYARKQPETSTVVENTTKRHNDYREQTRQMKDDNGNVSDLQIVLSFS